MPTADAHARGGAARRAYFLGLDSGGTIPLIR